MTHAHGRRQHRTLAGPGNYATIRALVGVAHRAGATRHRITAATDGAIPRNSGGVSVLPAHTMAGDEGKAATSILPMGSLLEGVQFLVFECLGLLLRVRPSVAPEAMRASHTNLEWIKKAGTKGFRTPGTRPSLPVH